MKNLHLPSPDLTAPREVELHYKRPLYKSMVLIKRSENANTYIRKFINTDRLDLKEFFWVMLLSSANRVMAFTQIGSGTTNGVAINVKEIFQLTLLTNASAIILCHNHPSGKLEISEADKTVTKKIGEAAEMLDIVLLDHLIITSESYLSFADEGEL
jgi:DNA repair protein RadC